MTNTSRYHPVQDAADATLTHMLDYKKYGDDYYKLFTPAQREQMVLDRLKKNRIWSKLNDAEREWSLNYPSTRR